MKNIIENLGFEKNTEVINGFKPHYKKGNDFLFLIGADYWPSKICRIDDAFKNHNGKIYGVLTEKSPRISALDWITASRLTIIKLDPLSKGQWNKNGTDIEYVATTV